MVTIHFSRPIRFTGMIFTIAALLLANCATPGASEFEHPPLKVAWSLWPGWYPIAIAQQQGFFEKHGVEVELVFYSSYADQLPDFGAGRFDGGLFTLTDALLLDAARPNGGRVVLATDYSDGNDSIVATADIQTVADLKGKRVGGLLGSFSEILIREMLNRKKFQPRAFKSSAGKTTYAFLHKGPIQLHCIQMAI